MDDAQRTFHELTGEMDYTMLIVTTCAEGMQAGCLVGFATQCSVDPPRFVVFLSNKNRTLRVAERSEALLVHFVPADAAGLVELFGTETGDDLDKFARCRWKAGPGGLPVLQDAPRWFAGKILERQAVGDHVGFLLEPFAAESAGEPGSFLFHRAKPLEPGHAP